MHVKKIINVSFKFEITILVYYTSISNNRDFLFELNRLNLLLYAYLVNLETRNIVVRNNSNKTIYILRNCRLRRITKLEFFNIFYIVANSNVLNLILRKTFANYKTNRFKKIIAITFVIIVVITSEIELNKNSFIIIAFFNILLTSTIILSFYNSSLLI